MLPPGKVVSVNVGEIREVAWRGQVVRTAIWKTPVTTRVWAGRLGLAGDQQADLRGHGGEQRAIMVYQLDSYRFWADHLGRADFTMGQFGENLTVEGLSDEDVCIGDRFRIGGAVVEVSQPRVSCFKLGLRMDHPSMPALVVAHRRPGFYFRVVQEGEVGAGDAVQPLAQGPERMSVAEIDALLFTGDHPVPALERALRIPALSPGWQGSMRDLLKAAGSERPGNAGLVAPVDRPSWPGFRMLHVLAKTAETEDVTSFVLADPDGHPLPPAKPGQHLVVRVAAAGSPLLRNYSLCGGGSPGTYRIAVKREATGAVSHVLLESVGTGDGLEASAPRGSFVLANALGPVVLISAGIGVTPLLAMLRALADPTRVPARRPVWWIHAARDGGHHVFAAEARTLAASASATTCIAYSRPGPADQQGVDFDEAGHIDQALLRGLKLPADATCHLCGPEAFMDAVTAGLAELGVEPARVLREAFGGPDSRQARSGAAHPPAVPEGEGPKVILLRSGLSTRWSDRFGNLLELAEACEVPVRWVCRTGVCHQCESGLIEGEVRYAPAPIDPPPGGTVLICCARPSGDVVLDL